MLIVGLLIAIAAVVFAVVVLTEDWGGATYAIHGFGHVLGHLTLAGIFLSGVILTAAFFFGLWLASVSGLMRRRASRRRRAETRATREQYDAIAADRDRLARDLETERATHANNPTGGYAAAYPRDGEVYRDRGVREGGAGTADVPMSDRSVDPSNIEAR